MPQDMFPSTTNIKPFAFVDHTFLIRNHGGLTVKIPLFSYFGNRVSRGKKQGNRKGKTQRDRVNKLRREQCQKQVNTK